MIVSVSDFSSFLKRILSEGLLSVHEIITPSKSIFNTGNSFFRAFRRNDSPPEDLSSCRTVDPVKSLFYFPVEKVLPAHSNKKARLIAGLKACDINALKILDTALLKSGFTDPVYQNWRSNTIIISSDCTSFLKNCFCTVVGERPFAEEGFDLNLSPTDNYYAVTTGSQKGEELLELMKKMVSVYSLPQNLEKKVKSQREEMVTKLNEHIQAELRNSEERHQYKSGDELWKEISGNCIGCGACTNICPSCYCIILNDESIDKEFVKVRTYDSCQLNGYARVAGGGTPRPKIYQRFRNRVMCKFSYMKSNFNFPGCTGCGRCMDVCSLGADFIMLGKQVLNKADNAAQPAFNKKSFEISESI